MSRTQLSSDPATQASGAGAVPMRLEVVVLPVADTERTTSFYQGLGWRLEGPDPESFSEPDGNGWWLQEVAERAPGRV